MNRHEVKEAILCLCKGANIDSEDFSIIMWEIFEELEKGGE